MEKGRAAEIEPEKLILARQVIEKLGFDPESADKVVQYGGETMSVAEGLAQHWDEASTLGLDEVHQRIASYIALADTQAAQA